MSRHLHAAQGIETPSASTLCQGKGMHLLLEAMIAARMERCDSWQFAVEIEQLLAAGMSHTDLRRLLCWGLLEHALERTTSKSGQRIFQPLNSLALPKRSCFVLTAKGWEVNSAKPTETVSPSLASDGQGEQTCCLREVPRWNSQLRQLWWKNILIKEFHRYALNQELVLGALEEEGWPPRIDDPLPQTTGIDAKYRLHDTIKSLNRNHTRKLLRFCGDGSGLGICWLVVKPA